MDDLEFRAIIEGFVSRLQEQVDAMQVAWKAGDTEELARLAHWLKGSGGTVGFDAFTEPARRLEQLAKGQEHDEIKAILREIKELAESIVVPTTEEFVS